MGSSAKIITTAPCNALVAFPNWRQPARCVVRVLGAGAATPTADGANSTDGVTITRSGVGILQVVFPAGKRIADINPQVWGVTPETAATRKTAKVDADAATTFAAVTGNPNGQIQLYVSEDVNAVNADLAVGDILEVAFSVDYG